MIVPYELKLGEIILKDLIIAGSTVALALGSSVKKGLLKGYIKSKGYQINGE